MVLVPLFQSAPAPVFFVVRFLAVLVPCICPVTMQDMGDGRWYADLSYMCRAATARAAG